jgi:hypothetical protein
MKPTLVSLCTLVVVPASLAACSAHAPSREQDRALTAAVEQEAAALPSVTPNRALDVTLNLLTRVKTDTGSVLEFYEPTPGDIWISEAGSDGATPSRALSRQLAPSAAYRAVAAGLPVPETLLAAESRLAAPLAASSVSAGDRVHRPAPGATSYAAPATPNPSGRVRSFAVDANAYCGRQWWVNNNADAKNDCLIGGQSFNWCFYDTGPGAWASVNNDNMDQAELCAATGDGITFSVNRQGDNNAGGIWSVPAPGWRSFWHTAGTNIFGGSNSYNVQIHVNGNWGDLQFAGDFNY